MKRTAVIAFMSFCCILRSQTITFSKVFETRRQNVPIAIINNHENYFYVMRYNKAAHDITLERRKKPDAQILSFTPLKLDSVNAAWFDYEKLDHLCFEKDHKLYFVFEKEMVSKQTVYLKVIDTTGKSGGFRELSVIEKDASVAGLESSFYKTYNNTVLVVTAINYTNGITKKTATLYDTKTLKQVWQKKLPYESSSSEITNAFTVNETNDLIYIHYKIKSVTVIKQDAVERKIINEFGPISIFKSDSGSKEIQQHQLRLSNIEAVYSATLIPDKKDIVFCGQVVERKEKNRKTFLYCEKVKKDFSEVSYSNSYTIPETVYEQLTFYDESEWKAPEFKNYVLKTMFLNKDNLFFVTERTSKDHYNELVCWNIGIQTGNFNNLEIIPRKTFYFSGRTRFKNAGEAMLTLKTDSLICYVSEHPGNISTSGGSYRFRNYKKQNGTVGNIVRYKLGNKSHANKKLIYQNRDFDLIPMKYISENVKDDVFYFNKGKQEKFGLFSD